MMRPTRIIGVLFCMHVLFASCSTNTDVLDKPNIILIYADDLGIGLLGHEGQGIIKTPNIDKLAEEGLRFQRAYSNMLCAPARASLISGLHDAHNKQFEITSASIYNSIGTGKYTLDEVETMVNSVLEPVPDEQVFLAEVAKDAGYMTAQFGKLEWGFAASHRQLKRHGWDYYLGYLDHQRAHGFYPPFLFENGKLKEIPGNTLANCGKSGEPETEKNFRERWDMTGKKVYSQHIFIDGILNFIRANKDHPFFLYFPTQLPHGPVSVPAIHPDFINDERLTPIEKEYASMVKMLDDHIGKIMNELKKLKIDDHTIVIFSSDNGHEIYYAQKGRVHKPYTNMKTGERFDGIKNKYYSELAGDVFDGNGGRAGMKRSNLQGGINVPLIIRWPQKIAQGGISKRLVANYDILPTIAEITGFSKSFHSDGISFLNELIHDDKKNEHKYVIYSSFVGPTLITNDGWKIRTYLNKDIVELYYFPDDYREENDLSKKHPEKLKELKGMLLKACDGDLYNGLYSTKNQIKVKSTIAKK